MPRGGAARRHFRSLIPDDIVEAYRRHLAACAAGAVSSYWTNPYHHRWILELPEKLADTRPVPDGEETA